MLNLLSLAPGEERSRNPLRSSSGSKTGIRPLNRAMGPYGSVSKVRKGVSKINEDHYTFVSVLGTPVYRTLPNYPPFQAARLAKSRAALVIQTRVSSSRGTKGSVFNTVEVTMPITVEDPDEIKSNARGPRGVSRM